MLQLSTNLSFPSGSPPIVSNDPFGQDRLRIMGASVLAWLRPTDKAFIKCKFEWIIISPLPTIGQLSFFYNFYSISLFLSKSPSNWGTLKLPLLLWGALARGEIRTSVLQKRTQLLRIRPLFLMSCSCSPLAGQRDHAEWRHRHHWCPLSLSISHRCARKRKPTSLE